MSEAQNVQANGTPSAVGGGKKRKGFWANLFGKSSSTDEKKEDKGPGFTSMLRQAATKGVLSIAEHEAVKEVEAQLDNNKNNNNGSQQPADTTTTSAMAVPDTSTTSEMLSSPTNWAKRMVDTAQQKVQSLAA